MRGNEKIRISKNTSGNKMAKEKNEKSSEFTINNEKLEDIQAIKTDVKLLEQNQKHLEKSLDKIDTDINDLFTNKSSKADVKTVAGDLKDHIKGHASWIIPLVVGLIALIGTYFAVKG